MNSHGQSAALSVLNRSAFAVQLRFYRDQHLTWDAWLAPGGDMSVPDPGQADVEVSAVFTDERSRVTYRVPTRVTGRSVRLVAKLLVSAGALRFSLDTEPGSQADAIEIQNLCAGTVRFDTRFMHSPFTLTKVLGPAAVSSLALSGIEVAAIINGITTTRVAIRDWASELLIDSQPSQDHGLPTLKLVTRGHRQ